jgi:hypothetical protein
MFLVLVLYGSRYSYGLDSPGSILGSARVFSTASRPILGSTQPPIQWVPVAISPRVKRSRREADHSPPSNAEVKNCGAISQLPRMSS